MSTIFGGNQQNQSSQGTQSNQAYPYLQQALSGNVSNGSAANGQLANMLGLNGTPAQNQGFQNWQNSTGYQFGLNQGQQSITGNAATQGLLNSGSTAKALDTYGQNYANTQYQNYLNPLQSLVNSGIQSGSAIGATGNVSQNTEQNTGSSNNGPGVASVGGGLLGTLLNK